MLQQEKPEDYVLATGRAESVRWFTEKAFSCVGINVDWRGQGADEVGICTKTQRVLIAVDPAFYRPIDVGHLCGDAAKAREALDWQPEITLEDMIKEMVEADLQ
jgi:GDPmannose 4,6-dehydratase